MFYLSEELMKPAQFNAIKNHVKEHRWKYIAGVGMVLVSGAAYAVGATYGAKQIVITDTANIKLFSPTTTNVTVILEELSTPSKPIWCPELKQAFNSINDASRKLGIRRSDIASCVGGQRESIKDLTFEAIHLA
jgi:hypothetical protein